MSDLKQFFGESAASFNPKGGAESFEIQDQGQVPTVEASDPEPKPPKGTPCMDMQGNLSRGSAFCPNKAEHYCIGHRIRNGTDFAICKNHSYLPTRMSHAKNKQYLCSQCSQNDTFDPREKGKLDKHHNLSKFYAGRDDFQADGPPPMESVFRKIR